MTFKVLRIFSLVLALGVSSFSLRAADDSKAFAVTEFQKKQDDTLSFKLEFRPVSTMDAVGNREMSMVMAFFYAEEVLSKHFNKDKAVSFKPQMYEVLKFDGSSCQIRFTIPCSAVRDVKGKKSKICVVMTREKDLTPDELKDFRSSCFRDLRIAETFYYDAILDRKDKKKLSADIRSSFDALAKKIDADDMLFLSEKEELQERVRKTRSFLLKKAEGKAASGRAENASRKKSLKLVSGFSVNDGYREMLLDHPAALTAQGCWIMEKDGKKYLVAVGSAPVLDDRPKARLTRSNFADVQLMSEIAKFRDTSTATSTTITRTSSSLTQNGRKKHTSERKVSSRIDSVSETHMSNMKRIGQWYSADRRMFFLARGCCLSQ